MNLSRYEIYELTKDSGQGQAVAWVEPRAIAWASSGGSASLARVMNESS
jgi:hypothetical protein